MPDELSPEEKALLENIEVFNQTYAATGWHVRDKIIRQNLSRATLWNSTIESSDMQFVEWNGADLDGSQFTSVRFFQTKFDGATLQNVVFTDCEFDGVSFSGSTLSECRFVKCRSHELTARQAAFRGCVFEQSSDISGVMGPGLFRGCRFEQCQFDNTAFHSTEFTDVRFNKSTLELVVFGRLGGEGLAFADSSLTHCDFGQSRFRNLTFERCKVRAVSINGFEGSDVVVKDCESIEAFRILESTLEKSSVTGCQAVSEFSVRGTKLADFTVGESRIAYFDSRASKVSGASVLSNCQIAGWNLGGSTLNGVQITNCGIYLYLILDGATLDAVQLSGITYTQVDFSERQVTYLNNSGRFIP